MFSKVQSILFKIIYLFGIFIFLLSACSLPGGTIQDPLKFEKVANAAVTPPQETQLQMWFAVAKKWVEAETGTPLDSVTLKLIPRAQMAVIGEATLNQLFIDSPVSYRLLRELKKRNGSDISAAVVALFDPVLNDILMPQEGLTPFSKTVVSNGSTLEEAYTALFIHELTHAADYSLYPENIIFNQKNLGNLAVRAVVEGHAQFLTRKICERQGCQKGYETLRDDVVSGTDSHSIAAGGAAQAGKVLSSFCYHHGERFFTSLEVHQGAIEKALAHPPTDPVMIRYPDVYLDGIREQKQKKLTAAFNSVEVPWNPDRSLLLHNTNFVPFDGYNTRKQLAQNNYEILHESEDGVDTTNVNIFWKSSAEAADSFFRRLLKPSRSRTSGDGRYEVKLLEKSSQEVSVRAEDAGKTTIVPAHVGKMAFSYEPTDVENQSITTPKVQQIFVGTSGPFVISVARFSPSASTQSLQQYTTNLLQALHK